MTQLDSLLTQTSPDASPAAEEARPPARQSPLRAPIAFRVGVVGHRPDRLAEAGADLGALADVLREILSTVKWELWAMQQRLGSSLFDGTAAVFRALSPLAEGADRIFAEQALDLGYELCCVMPFTEAEYERDFTGETAREADSLNRFRSLLGRATTRFELDGSRADKSRAYGFAGRVILNQSDLLVMVWDGDRRGKLGGTEATFDEARRQGVPVVWVDAWAPHRWQVLDPATSLAQVFADERPAPDDAARRELLRQCVRDALELHSPQKERCSSAHSGTHEVHEDPGQGLRRFYSERQPARTMAVAWKAFSDVVADSRKPTVHLEIAPFEENKDVIREWPKELPPSVDPVVDQLRPYYTWPDRLAILYADRYRSAFILAFLLSAVAVGTGLLPLSLPFQLPDWANVTCAAVELTAILLILALVMMGRSSRWHERWIDYRLAAELVRHLLIVGPLGGKRPYHQISLRSATNGQPGFSWMVWYVRALERAVGLPSVVANRAHLLSCLGHLDNLVKDQILYHTNTARRYRRMEERLHGFGIILFLLTLLACGLHLALHLQHAHHIHTQSLTFLCGFLPALGAALTGIVNQGEFRRIARCTDSTREQLELLEVDITRLHREISESPNPPRDQFSDRAAELAGDAVHLLLEGVINFQKILLDRPLHLPS